MRGADTACDQSPPRAGSATARTSPRCLELNANSWPGILNTTTTLVHALTAGRPTSPWTHSQPLCVSQSDHEQQSMFPAYHAMHVSSLNSHSSPSSCIPSLPLAAPPPVLLRLPPPPSAAPAPAAAPGEAALAAPGAPAALLLCALAGFADSGLLCSCSWSLKGSITCSSGGTPAATAQHGTPPSKNRGSVCVCGGGGRYCTMFLL